jgi:Fe-S oxidoreductase
MSPNRELNYCCGGGAGMLMEERMDVRMKLAKMKAEQLRALGRLDTLVAPCASCKAQLPHVIKHYELDSMKVSGVMEIMGMALQL